MKDIISRRLALLAHEYCLLLDAGPPFRIEDLSSSGLNSPEKSIFSTLPSIKGVGEWLLRIP